MTNMITKNKNVRKNPSYSGPFATKIKLATLYDDHYPDGMAKVELGSVWTLDRPVNEQALPFGFQGPVLHKVNRPYIVLTEENHNRTTGLVTVVPSTTFSGRLKPPQGFREGLSIEYAITLSEKQQDLLNNYPDAEVYSRSFVNCYGVLTVSIDRFKEYLHTIKPDDLRKVRDMIELTMSTGDENTFGVLFPGYPDPSKQHKK